MSSGPLGNDEDDTTSIASSSKPWAGQSTLSKPLYVYQLPSELLKSLKLRSIDVQESEQAAVRDLESPKQQNIISNGTPSTSKSCAVCPKAPSRWESMSQARAHVRSDWHRYNAALVKRKRPDDCLDEAAFAQLVEELSSESSSDESDAEEKERTPVDHVAALLHKLRIGSSSTADSDSEAEGATDRSSLVAKEPYLWFVTKPSESLNIPQTQFGVLRALFSESESDVVPKDWHITRLLQAQCKALLPQQVPRQLKRFKGSSAASEAAGMLSAIFMDASGETGEEEDMESDSSGEGADSDHETVTTTSASIAMTPSQSSSPLRTWTILMMAGGNFSAVVIALNPREAILSKRKGTSERQYLILARKQIHRYTTRRKQGGAQSTQDSSGKFAKSAGAQLRRYGEQQLGEEIRELLSRSTWRDAIRNSEKVWVRAGLRSARGVLWNWQSTSESPLDVMRKEDKVQNLPIATRKPTVGECLRCFAELTKVRIRHDTEEQMQAKDEAYRAQLENSARAKQERRAREKERLRKEAEVKEAEQAAKKKAAKLDDREIIRRERFTRLIDMIRKGRLENTINHLEKYEKDLLRPNGWDSDSPASDPDDVDDAMEAAKQRINIALPFWWRYQDAREKGTLLTAQSELTGVRAQLVPTTLLQVAAEGGHANQVSYFLIERHSDPTISVLAPPLVDATEDDASKKQSFPHRTAYDLCSTRGARDVFRRLMASQPSWCDWARMEVGGARVVKALTSEMEEAREREEKVRDKRQAMKDKARQRQQEEETKKAHALDVAQMEAAAAAASKPPPPPSSTIKNRLGGSNSAPRALQKERDDAAGLTPEVRARIEREKRARAAEARFKALQGGGSQS